MPRSRQMRWSIARVYASVMVVASVAVGASSCARPWDLPGSQPDASASASASGGRGGGAAASGGMTGTGGAPGSGAFGGNALPPVGAGGSGCLPNRIEAIHHTANVMFVVDRTMSMGAKFGETSSRMNAVRDAIMNTIQSNSPLPMNSPLRVAYGYQDFPALTASCSPQNPCCLDHPYAPNPNQVPTKEFKSEYGQCPSSGSSDSCVATSDSRPVSQALASVRDTFWSTTPSFFIDFFVVLLIDGTPGCPSGAAPQDCTDERDAVSAFSAGTKVFVVAIGDDTLFTDGCLKSMASASPVPNPLVAPGVSPLLQAANFNDLKARLSQIADNATESWCTLDLQEPPKGSVTVWLDEKVVSPTDSKNGWAFTSQMRIKLSGDSCTSLLMAPSDVKVMGCR